MPLHPRSVRAAALQVRQTYYLGAIAAAVWIAMAVTGVLMMFHLRPTAPEIYDDLKNLQFAVEYGALVRNAHRWGASVMVVVVVLHLLRTFFHRTYLPPRRSTWYLGLGLFVVTMLSAHSGYLLPWDQRAYWGITIATTMAGQMPLGDQLRYVVQGGQTIGPATVLHIYVLHCLLIPLVTVVLVVTHLARVRQTGIVGAGDVPLTVVPAVPHLLVREIIVLQAVVAVLIGLALTGAPPLEAVANPQITPDPVKAPWYFVGLQEVLHYFPPVAGGALVPAFVLGLLAAAPFALSHRHAAPGSSLATAALVASALTVTVLLAVYEAWVLLGPTLVVEAAYLWAHRAGAARGLRGWLGRRVAVEWVMIWLVAVTGTATMTGALFRGAGGLLTMPALPWR